jgi:acetoin utilization deacetylase AcuC-like enzyme
MIETLLLSDAAMALHDPGHGHPECPDRLHAIEAILGAQLPTGAVLRAPKPAQPEALKRVHSHEHVRRMLELESEYAVLDPDTRVSPASIPAALLAAGAAIDGVDAVCRGVTKRAFALVRPPGHHAEADRPQGFCLFNNVAVAVARARTEHGCSRILVVDWDVHHGNGTQAIFYDDPHVLFFSTHQYPFYPGTGGLSETGRGAGFGHTINVPLSSGAMDGDYRFAFHALLEPVAARYRPDLVLVSAGFDAHRDDPLGGMELTEEGFADLCAIVQGIADQYADGRLMLLLEGGYDLVGLARSVLACTRVLSGSSPPGAAGATTVRGETEVQRAIAHHRTFWAI